MRAIICSLLTGLVAVPALASPVKVEAEDAADHQVSAQGTYRGGLPHSWEWRFGSKRSGNNITGVVAHGLLAAHALTGLDEHQKSALRAAKSLIAAYDRGWRNRRPHTQDIEFLVAAGYVIDAARWFGVLTRQFSAERFVDHVIARRSKGHYASMSGWDVASAIRAATSLGKIAYARALIDRLIERRGAWDVEDRAAAQPLSYGSLLWALGDFKNMSKLSTGQQRFARSMLRRLVAAQHSSGGIFHASSKTFSTQATAYAALGLSRWRRGEEPAAHARAWLRQVAVQDEEFFAGGRMWASEYGPHGRPKSAYHSEVQSEVLRALAGK